ncbi:MAG: hypothetical protein ABEH90_11080 [Halolamina sp.]
MPDIRNAVRLLGAVIALGGLALATAFVGVRTADPVAGIFVDLTVWRQAAGVLAGLLLFGVGLGLARLAMPEDEKRT